MSTLVLLEQSPQEAPAFVVATTWTSGCQRVYVSGELDLAARELVYQECTVGGPVVIVELSELEFMDCAGYGALMLARRKLERRGGSLTLRGSVGQPARLLALISACDVQRRGLEPMTDLLRPPVDTLGKLPFAEPILV